MNPPKTWPSVFCTRNSASAAMKVVRKQMLAKLATADVKPSSCPYPSPFQPDSSFMKDIQAEFHPLELINSAVPLSDHLTYALILAVFRLDHCLWRSETRASAARHPFTPCIQLSGEAKILPFYQRHSLLCCSYLPDAGYLEIRIVSGKPDVNDIENFEVRPTPNQVLPLRHKDKR